MSEYERNKFYKKKFNSQRGDRNEPKPSTSRYNANKTLYKAGKDTRDSSDSKEPEAKMKQPQILIKVREKTEEPAAAAPKSTKDKEEAPKEQTQPIVVEARLFNTPKKMTKSFKLLDDGVICNENFHDFLDDSCIGYVVVGIVGGQRVGKSTIANLLAGEKFSSVFSNNGIENGDKKDTVTQLGDALNKCTIDGEKKLIFRQESEELCENAIHTTSGIDMFITDERLIILDCQSFLSASLYKELSHSDMKRSNFLGDFSTADHMGEVLGLQHIAFLMSVCHVLIFVQDYFMDINSIRYLLTAEMLKPTINNIEDEYSDHFPHLLLLHNKAHMDDFTPDKFMIMQHIYRQLFSNSKMRTESRMGYGTGFVMSDINPKNCGDPFNLFLLPDFNDLIENFYHPHPSVEKLQQVLKMHVCCATKYLLSPVQLNEKNWLVYCAKVWEHVKKSPFYVEYAKLLS